MCKLNRIIPVKRKVKKVIIVCPKAPSGASWLLNALICLEVRVGRSSSPNQGTFVMFEDGFYRLHEAESSLKLHFPVLSEMEKFTFIEDVFVEWTHDWVIEDDGLTHTFILVRDPRDALFSYYRRRNAKASFSEFLYSIDYLTLLNQVDSWRLFTESWIMRGNVSILRYEDFKKDPELYLTKFITNIGVKNVRKENMHRAIESSHIENAKEKENSYKKETASYFASGTSLNRKGMPYEWKSQFEQYESEYQFITNRCIKQITALGYELLPNIQDLNTVPTPALGFTFDQEMPEKIMRDWISHLCINHKISILRFYEDFLKSGKMKYGFYESWELEIFEKNMIQFVLLILPEKCSINSQSSLINFSSLAINYLTNLNAAVSKDVSGN